MPSSRQVSGGHSQVVRQDRENFKAGIASYATQLRKLRGYLERSERQSSVSGGAGSASTSAMPAAFTTFLEESGALQLAIPAPSATSASSEASVPTTPVSSGTLSGAAATSGSSTSLTVDSDTTDVSGPVIPSSHHKGKRKGLVKSSPKLQSTSLPSKKQQRLGRPSVDLKARKAAMLAASTAASCSGNPQRDCNGARIDQCPFQGRGMFSGVNHIGRCGPQELSVTDHDGYCVPGSLR
ncbi:unnamed protein product [Phytophthora fragariaefolia]|uniref:Unnamed protein product n=1 Tax=Phytophthora fragariaefolia TaxID=1490495 RepID=A0A9W6XIV7_9STRA|nr:unnamed protein product [Phytophthora fragariaefolia]